ncbi:Endonuclease/Exonuclease/phosphatase family protein [Monaibacterium marinum]|uniref:Endonuclease/Exonuclease/phosphatase family protein n=1 Tax=Pontivivens marinum TaxID=1690039 RepID=A0A2C9CWL9_9RHOB|nr:endonuclease [Monaibacterium marinum]SOH95694.1 Endonuclease/Exonuclease/phosphatase family protein [Monaibacterium marinum]
MIRVVEQLTLVTDAERNRILTDPRTPEAHRALMADIPAMTELQRGGTATREVLPKAPNVIAWNLERCLFPEQSAEHLVPHSPTLILLSEMDSGMSRTGQRNTTAAMADALGMCFAYGVEFHELGLGGPTERQFCKDDFNEAGWHGNAILSAAPMRDATMIRLDDHGHWFCSDIGASDPEQPRVGGRMAIAAIIETEAGPVCAVSTHLESNADEAHRQGQMERLLDGVDSFAGDLPVVLGGDLNTGNHLEPDFDWRRETLFDYARGRGYHWHANPDGITTRASLITPHITRQMKLDWFALRGFEGADNAILSSIGISGTPLSDHDPVLTTLV